MTSLSCTEISLASVGPDGSFDLSLQRQAMVSIPDAASLRVSCAEGAVWITLDQSTEDVVLQAGDVFTTPEHRRAIVYALKPSRIAVAAPVVAKKPVSRRQPVFSRAPRLPLAFSAVWA